MNHNVKKLTLTAMFLAIGLLLPFLTGQIQQIGSMLLPMHLPVFLCALICGWRWGVPMAFILPLLRSLIFGMPPLYPTALAMAFELAAYAFIAGFLFERAKKQGIVSLYVSIVAAMIGGRIVWGIVQVILLGLAGNPFTFEAFLAGAILNAIPGIIVQLILIPVIMIALDRTKLVPFRREPKEA
jgi:riboflavin transporter FmnP